MKGQQHKRRLLAFILSIILVLCMMPSIAIAETFDDTSDQTTQVAEGEALSLPQTEGGEDSELKTEPETQPEGEGLQPDLKEDEGSQTDLPDLPKEDGSQSDLPDLPNEDGSQSDLPDLTKNEEPQADPVKENPEVPSVAENPGNNQEPEGKSAGFDNPDHLSKPDDSPYAGKINYNSYPETPFLSAPLSRSSKSGTKANDPPIIGIDHPTEEGEVMLFKEATPVEGMVNTWDITLRIEGKEYYLIEKVAPEGYAKFDEKIYFTIEPETEEITGPQHLEVTNDIPRVDVAGNKVWDDNDDQDGKRPDSITINLYKKDGEADKFVDDTTVAPDEKGIWAWSFTGLPKYDSNKNEIEYFFKESEIGFGYVTTITGDMATGYTVTNTKIPDTVDVKGKKTWIDANDQDGKRPESITINLYKDAGKGEITFVDSKVVEADAEGNWTWSFANLPKYENGVEIVYSISEEAVAGYTSEVSGYNVTNRYAPAKISFPVTKVWAVINGPTNGHPDSITIKLIANGQDTGKTLVLSKDNDWTNTFIELDRFKDGKEIVYTIDEILVENYECIITGDAENGFVVLNTQIKSTNIIPETGERGGAPWMSFALLSLACVLLVLRKKRSSELKAKAQKNTES